MLALSRLPTLSKAAKTIDMIEVASSPIHPSFIFSAFLGFL
jgi:hypothetical protein